MKKTTITILLIGIWAITNAQESIMANVSKSGNEVSVETSKNFILLYEESIMGNVTFSDRTYAKAKLNVNLLQDEILFVDDNNALLPIKDQNSIQYAAIGKDVFFKTSKGLIQVIANVNEVQLGISRKFKTKNTESSGAYGMSSSTSSTTQYSAFIIDGQKSVPTLSQLTVNQKVELSYSEQFYLIKNGKYIYISGIKQFSKIFNIDKKELEKYAAQENITLNSRDGLLKLFNYCNSK